MSPSPDNITTLHPNEIFVFGSNTQGRHGAGAALHARRNFGAKYGIGMGYTGQCYAIATKDGNLRTLKLENIEVQVVRFLDQARANPGHIFLVTEIGCGLAGYTAEQIAPMFKGTPENVRLPARFIDVLSGAKA